MNSSKMSKSRSDAKLDAKKKDELMYSCAEALYGFCTMFCSVPSDDVPCYGQVRHCKGIATGDPPCDKCFIGAKRELAVKAMDATDFQKKSLSSSRRGSEME